MIILIAPGAFETRHNVIGAGAFIRHSRVQFVRLIKHVVAAKVDLLAVPRALADAEEVVEAGKATHGAIVGYVQAVYLRRTEITEVVRSRHEFQSSIDKTGRVFLRSE